MAKKKVVLNYNPKWIVSYEYKHNKDLILPGSEVKIKYERGTYKFEKHVIHSETGAEWLDVIGFGGYRSFPIDKLKGIIKPKKKREKKNV